MKPQRSGARTARAALAIGVGLCFVVNLEPIWMLAWFLPGLLFAVALQTDLDLARPDRARRAHRRRQQLPYFLRGDAAGAGHAGDGVADAAVGAGLSAARAASCRRYESGWTVLRCR